MKLIVYIDLEQSWLDELAKQKIKWRTKEIVELAINAGLIGRGHVTKIQEKHKNN